MASISVVIPAYNREATLAVSLDALLAQTHEDWEAIVIDDGSADRTAEVAEEYARRDARFRVHRQPNGGVSAARNRGIELAQRPWLFFLDADDWITPEAFALLSAALERHPDAELVNAGCIRVLPDGTEILEERAPTGDDLFLTFARTCAFSIHTSLVRTETVRVLGGFDTSLVTCEDWDLWQRITRTGTRFAAIPEYVAYYRMRPGSASGNGRRMLEDGIRVIARGHGEDPRLAGWRGPLRAGEPSERARPARMYLAAYAAGLEIARGGDARGLLDLLPEREAGDLSSGGVAATLFHAVASGRGVGVAQWSTFTPEVNQRLHEFISAFAAFVGDGWLAFGIEQELETLILLNSPADQDLLIGRTQVVRVRLDEPVGDVAVKDGSARVLLDPRHGDEQFAPVALPVFGDRVPAAVVADALVDAHGWELLRQHLRDTVFGELDVERGDRLVVRRGSVKLLDAEVDSSVAVERAIHDYAGWDLFLQELWGRPDWPHDRFYAKATRRVLPDRVTQPVPAGQVAFVEVADELPDIVDAPGPLDVPVTLAGVPLMRVRVVPERGRVTAQALRSAITYAGGFELVHVTLREGVLLYDGPGDVPLRERLAAAARRRAEARDGADPFAEGWTALADEVVGPVPRLVLGRRRYGQLAGAASRLVQLPPGNAADLRELAQRTGQPIAEDGDEPTAALYAPFLIDARHDPVELGARSRARAAWFEQRLSYTAPHLDRSVGELRRPDVLSLLPDDRVQRALEVGCADAELTGALADRAGELLVCDISWLALQQAATRQADRNNVSFQRRDLFEEPLDAGHDLVVCGDVLRWTESRAQLRTAARRLAGAVAPGGTLVITSSAPRAGEIERALVAGGRLVLREEVEGATFKVQRYERPERRLPGRRAAVQRRASETDDRHLVAAAATTGDAAPDRGSTQTIPVLMYHRVATTGHPRARRWRLTPDEFEEQLAYLRDEGYRSLDIDEWAAAVDQDRSIPARSVVLTFDDGFCDFGEHAVPLLRRYGFRAELFVVTDHVGGTDSWDEGWDAREPLLDWDALLDLPPDVVRIGSHTARHRALTAIPAEDAVRELVRSRIELEDRLGRRVATIAYPYGLVDRAVASLAGAVGYEVGFTTMPWWVYPSRNLLQLPRLEVRGGDALATFARMVERPIV